MSSMLRWSFLWQFLRSLTLVIVQKHIGNLFEYCLHQVALLPDTIEVHMDTLVIQL